MSNAADVIRPYGATHVAWSGGNPHYYKVASKPSSNITQSHKAATDWKIWNSRTRQWESVVAGFVPDRLKQVKH
jgi:hypothetical protein